MDKNDGDTMQQTLNDGKCIYADFFGLHSDPFGLTPDPEYYYSSHNHATILEWIIYAVEQHEMALVIGEVGSGKTVLSRCLIDYLPEKEYRVCCIINPRLTATGMLKEIYRRLFNDEPRYYKNDIINQIQTGLATLFERGIFPVVIIDEAHMIPSKAVFDELRLLSNFQTDKQNLLSLVLFGQPELGKRLQRKYYRAFLQRIRFTATLNPLTQEEIRDYLIHRLQKAGYLGKEIFPSETIKKIYEITRGIPRPINHLATFSLMQAMSEESKFVTLPMVKKAAKSIPYLKG